MFSQVSFCSQGGYIWSNVLSRGVGYVGEGWVPTPLPGHGTWDTVVYGRSASGRYASYWNAFLFSILCCFLIKNAKVEQIRAIWKDGLGVVTLHAFQSTIPVEAYTREACMILALGEINHITNNRIHREVMRFRLLCINYCLIKRTFNYY